MVTIESFSTAGMDPRRKLAFRNDHVSESLTPLVSEPADVRDFNGSISQVSIDDMSLAEVCSDAQIVRHSRYHVSRSTRRYEILFTGSNRMLVLSIPDRTLRRQLGCPENLVAVPMSCDRGANRLLSQLLRGSMRISMIRN